MNDARLDRLAATGPDENTPRLEPEGTARQRFLRSQAKAPKDEWGALYARARALDLPPALVDAARFLRDLAPDAVSMEARNALMQLAMVVLLDMRMGSTRTPVGGSSGQDHLRQRLAPLFGHDEAERNPSAIERLLETGIPGVLGSSDEPKTPLLIAGTEVATQRLFVLEDRVGARLQGRLADAPMRALDRIETAVDDVLARPPVDDGRPRRLSDEQRAAVERAASLRLSVISGGPGTGKTSIVVAILRTMVRLGVAPQQISVAAPTGKAAQRLTEAIRGGLGPVESPSPEDERLATELPAAETLHRLLGYHPRSGRFARNHEDPLSASLVVVDEASMIDLRLMDALLAGLPDEAQLVLLGDADQLPSVDAGAVLRDLRASDPPGRFSVLLTHSYRMDAADPRGAEILRAAQALRRGKAPDVQPATRPAQLAAAGFELLRAETVAARRRFIDAWVGRHMTSRSYQRTARRILLHRNGAFRAEDIRTLETIMARLATFRLLAVTRSEALSTGAAALNAAVHERLVAEGIASGSSYAPGEPVMMLKNDYERGLFNGDVGVVMQVAIDHHSATPMVVFSTARGFEPFPQALLQSDLTLAHAMTVHKAQGSEFDEIALVLPEIDVPVLSREVLYTGLTRAKTAATIVGAPALVQRAVARPVLRHSALARMLAEHST